MVIDDRMSSLLTYMVLLTSVLHSIQFHKSCSFYFHPSFCCTNKVKAGYKQPWREAGATIVVAIQCPKSTKTKQNKKENHIDNVLFCPAPKNPTCSQCTSGPLSIMYHCSLGLGCGVSRSSKHYALQSQPNNKAVNWWLPQQANQQNSKLSGLIGQGRTSSLCSLLKVGFCVFLCFVSASRYSI